MLDFNPKECVHQIIATHWHSDHIQGLAKTLEVCESAQFWCSDALRCGEFLTLVQSYANYSMMEKPGLDEFDRILKILIDRNQTPKFAIANRILHEQSINSATKVVIKSLSPSDKSILQSKIELIKLLPQKHQTKLRVFSQTPNHAAIVISINVDEEMYLFGADLENTSDKETGWNIIIESKMLGNTKACYFKIPHHGSMTSYNEKIWQESMSLQTIAVLTPFINGSNIIPNQDEINQIDKHSQNTYSTSKAIKTKRKKRDGMVDRTIKETVKSIQTINTNYGQVRYRKDFSKPSQEELIECFNNACRLKEIYS